MPWFEAYYAYDVAPDDAIWVELHKHQQESCGRSGAAGFPRQEAISRAVRTGLNTAPGIARAEALGRKIERSTHALLKSFACEIEKSVAGVKTGDSPSSAFVRFERTKRRAPEKAEVAEAGKR